MNNVGTAKNLIDDDGNVMTNPRTHPTTKGRSKHRAHYSVSDIIGPSQMK